MTILITGGAGYIGSHVVKLLVQNNREVVVLDDLSRGNRMAIEGVPLVVGDYGDSKLVSKIIEMYGVESVVHLAGLKSVAESMAHPYLYVETNILKGTAFLNTLVACGVRRVVFSSSCSVYGNPTKLPVTEDFPLLPQSMYAVSKVVQENFLHFCQPFGLEFISLRYFNAAGASAAGDIGEDWNYSTNLIPMVMRSLLISDKPVVVFGTDHPTPDGTCIRDYVHVTDLAYAHFSALEALESGTKSLFLNLGTGNGNSVREIIRLVEEYSGQRVPVVYGAARDGDPSTIYANSDLAAKVLNWKASLSIEDIIQTAYNWHSKV